MEPHELQVADPVDGARYVVHAEAELRVDLAGGDVVVRGGRDAGSDPQEHALPRRHPLEPLELVERVDDDVADAGVERLAQLVLALVVAVQVDALGRASAPQCQVQLAAGGDVAGEPLLHQQAEGRGARERLARVDDLEVVGARAERVHVLTSACADVVLRVDVRRGAELVRELHHVAAAHLEPAALVQARAERVDVRKCGRLRCRGHKLGRL